MTPGNIHGMSVDQLVKYFVEICMGQDQAILFDQHKKYNELFEEMGDVATELKSRAGDERRALTCLYNHPNAQVRLKAAIVTLAVAPTDARRVLQSISDRNEYPQAADARGMLRALDQGTYVPN